MVEEESNELNQSLRRVHNTPLKERLAEMEGEGGERRGVGGRIALGNILSLSLPPSLPLFLSLSLSLSL
jgi:hypothetical protein